ncbi:hypothetical protein PENSTE_c001G00561 [Penicillium steckii]|uniref:Uncharacterized protein n=1 Tax=Penicillium steckii TaxID=303698 RepID=A0A1V6U0F6_9EURO|nr:hypothetical protein PENSTE_c001G00561 [Penicillium steckii]
MKFLNILVLSAIAGFASAAAVPGPDTAIERDGGLVEKRCADGKCVTDSDCCGDKKCHFTSNPYAKVCW